jgi:hypothetical protein
VGAFQAWRGEGAPRDRSQVFGHLRRGSEHAANFFDADGIQAKFAHDSHRNPVQRRLYRICRELRAADAERDAEPL